MKYNKKGDNDCYKRPKLTICTFNGCTNILYNNNEWKSPPELTDRQKSFLQEHYQDDASLPDAVKRLARDISSVSRRIGARDRYKKLLRWFGYSAVNGVGVCNEHDISTTDAFKKYVKNHGINI